MFFRYFRGSGPSRVPISKIWGFWAYSCDERVPVILRPREHFAPDFGVMIFDDFSRGHFS